MPFSTLGADGVMTITDPVANTTASIDPSTLPGYYGNFKCETADTSVTDCNMRQMGMTDDGSFTYNFKPNEDLLNATNTATNTELETSTILRKKVLKTEIDNAFYRGEIDSKTKTIIKDKIDKRVKNVFKYNYLEDILGKDHGRLL